METPYNWENSTKKGPWGGQGGREWRFKPNGPITEIIITHGSLIDSISFKSINIESDTFESSKRFGGDGGGLTKISIDWPKEYLTSISGTYRAYETSYAIQSLCFNTNRTTYGPFGDQKDGSPFEFSMEGGIIVGFYGRAGTLLDAIGIYVKPYASLWCPPSRLQIIQDGRDVLPVQYLLKVKSYSLLPDAQGQKYESDTFDVGGYKWKLILYPNGDKTCNGKGHISLYLAIHESNFASRTENLSVCVDLKFFMLNQNTNKYVTFRDAKGRLMFFDKLRTEQGFSQLLPLYIFKDPCNGYLVDDYCAFGAEFSILQPSSNTREETLTMIKDPYGKNYSWEIKNFLALNEADIYSDEFTIAGRKWRIRVSPKGDKVEGVRGKYLSAYLKSCAQTSKVFVKVQLRVPDHRGVKSAEYILNRWFDGQSDTSWGTHKLMLLSDIAEPSNEYLKDGALTIQVNFYITSMITVQ